MKNGFLALALLILGASAALAKVTLPEFFSDNMVFQQGVAPTVWGKAGPGEEVTATLGDSTATATTADDGWWSVKLEPISAGGPFEMTVAGQNAITIKNVMVGEVWFCGGQSNMDFKVKDALNAEKDIAAGDFPNLRLCFGRYATAKEPLREPRGKWAVCTPETVKDYSAVAYFFGRDLHQNLNVPVGLIWVSCGWTPSEAWTSREALAADPEIKRDVLDKWDDLIASYPERKAAYEKKLAEWKAAEAAAKEKGEKFDTPEPRKVGDPMFIHAATALYNGGIAPYTRFPIKGVVWYQGETNADRGIQYRKLFPILINDWRNQWGQPEMPFLFVQIAALGPPQAQPDTNDRAELREAQMMALKLPNTGMAVTIDIGDEKNEHPKNKQDVGARLALAARAIAYGQKIVYSGPIYDSMKIEGGKIRINFKHVGGGLVAKGGELKGFSIAGEDRKFLWANAKIDGETVVVWSAKVPRPAAVRYGWAMNPVISLYNKEGLPASPFRTDDWPGVTTGKTQLWYEMYAK
ncbi:MAG TPA: sialate O-acetylesterase [Planctomycetota bacterium]|nr:sialate O-acetylesterase [Planctomycetota bacterium]